MAEKQDMYDAREVVIGKLKDIKGNFTPRELFLFNQAIEELYGIDSQDLEESFETSTYNTENK